MKLVLVRHGHPNYELDCLTPLGHLQAKEAAERLEKDNIQSIYASSCGRAVETSEYTARKYGLSVTQLPFMQEVIWGYNDDPHDPAGHPWNLVEQMVLEGKTLMDPAWQDLHPFQGNRICENVNRIASEFDHWLEHFGYIREGEYYRCGENTEKTVALFSHGGSSCAVVSHLLNLPFPFCIQTFRLDFTSVTVLRFPDTPGKLVVPSLELVNDAAHIQNLRTEIFFGN